MYLYIYRRSLTFISIFCALALLFTSLTPLSVFAEDPLPATGEDQVEAGSQDPNGGITKQPANPEVPETPKQPEKPEQPGQPANPQNPGKSVDQGTHDPQVGQKSVPENNDSAPKPTLVINEVQAGDTVISGEIKTEELFPPYDIILEIVNAGGIKKYETILGIRLRVFTLSGI
ncbi:MAG: hypothetical protein PUG74_06545 [Prevotellaceae bacterium]|nr:hypothetical protein [Prevotellaceae bacterium]